MSFLTDRFNVLCEKYPGTRELGILRDPRGVFGIQLCRPDGRQYNFCAKRSCAGSTVSVHENLLGSALMYRRGIIMAIGYDYYRYAPTEILRLQLFRNERYGAIMVNFNMEIGTPLGDGATQLRLPMPDPAPRVATQPVQAGESEWMKATSSAIIDLFGGERIDTATG